ncbi:MAG: AAA family ATPase, partial [Candidatus Heimdallarchaeaceae archaeon]
LYTLLRWNIGCVIDGTFYKETLRAKVKRIADKFNAQFLLVIVECPESLVKQRFEQREKRQGRTLSDANYEIYLNIKERFQPSKLPHIVLNVTDDKYVLLGKIEDALRKRYS